MTCNTTGYSLANSRSENGPHFLLPLPNGDHMCFSMKEQSNFAYSLISDKYIKLNGLFVLPTEEESHTISNISAMLIRDLGLVVRNPKTGNTTIIKISAQDHSVAVGNSVTIIKDKSVTVQVLSNVKITIIYDNEQTSGLKDTTPWLYIKTKGFAIKVKFYENSLDMFLTKTSGLTKNASGIIGIVILILVVINVFIITGQFLAADVLVDEDDQLIKLSDGHSIPVKKAPIWPFMGISGDCWHSTSTDNQGAQSRMLGVYTDDYIVEHLITPN